MSSMAKSPVKHKEPIMGSLNWPYRETGMSGASHYLWWAFCMEENKNYIKYYFLEEYIFGEVKQNFDTRGYLTPEEFFSIVIWKANRAKTNIKKKLNKYGTLSSVIKNMTSEIYSTHSKEKKLEILQAKWHFYLPMATAILSVLYPEDFTIYDIRVREQLGLKESSNSNKYWTEYLPAVKSLDVGKTLREKDQYLWGKSFYGDLEKLING